MDATIKQVRCKFCNSKNIIKYGNYKDIQRWWCKNCHRKFADNNALPGMKTDLRPVTFAVGSYYDGVPVSIIIQEIEKNHCIYISDSTIFKWIDKFSKMAAKDTRDNHPRVGNTWIANETAVDICRVAYRLIDIIDQNTMFIINTMLFNSVDQNGIAYMIDSARRRVGKNPHSLLIFHDAEYLNRSETKRILENRHIRTKILNNEADIEMQQRVRDTYLNRNQILSRLKRRDNVKTIIDGWLVHYNYRRDNELLDGKTPAEKANLSVPN